MATSAAAASSVRSSSSAATSAASLPISSASSQSSPLALGPTFQCEQCRCSSQFIGIPRVVRLVGVSRSTIYYWMERGWIHWRLLPSGRRVICLGSLSSSGEHVAPMQKAL